MSYRLHDPDAFDVEFGQAIILVILFSLLLANGMEICSTSAAHMSPLLSPLADFEQVIVSVSLFFGNVVNWTLICSMSAVLVH